MYKLVYSADWNQRPNSSQNLKVVIVNRKASRDSHFKVELLCYYLLCKGRSDHRLMVAGFLILISAGDL